MSGTACDFSRLIAVSDIVECTGPDHDDAVWNTPLPYPGEDMVFDTVFSDGVETHYVLRPKPVFRPLSHQLVRPAI